MLNLSINEQKQIAGGVYQVIVYNRAGRKVTERRFGNYQAAMNFARGPINAGLRVDIKRI